MTTPLSWESRSERANLHTGPVDGTASWLTYETFYGLKEQPFALSSDPRFFYRSPAHAVAFAELNAGIRRRERLCMLAGDVGTGKTTLCRTVLENLDRKTFSAFVPDPFASREDLLKVLLVDFGVVSVDDLTTGRMRGASRTELSYVLYDFLDTLAPLKAFVVVVIDEAQNLSHSLLEEVRILSDSDGRERQLQVVLVGQPELRQKLTLPELRQVDQRIAVRGSLEPLDMEGVAGYIAHRLQVAGGSVDRVRFSSDAVELIHRTSGGVPRVINRLCDRSLSVGHQRHASLIDAAMVREVCPAPAVAPPAARPSVPNATSVPSAVPQEAPATIQQGQFAERVNEWLSGVDGHIESVERAAPHHPAVIIDCVTSPSSPKEQLDPAIAQTPHATSSDKTGRVIVPRTYMQRMIRRWSRRFAVVALWVAAIVILAENSDAIVGAIAGEPSALMPPPAPSFQSMMPAPIAPISAERAQLAALEPAVEAPQGTLAIQLGLFKSVERADQLVETLTAAGYRAYQAPVNLGDRGVLLQVLIGPFASPREADSALVSVRRMDGLGEAIIVHRPSSLIVERR